MAHFAQIGPDNRVVTIMRISDDDITDDDGNEIEAKGVALCQTLVGADTTWVQVSINTRAGVHPEGRPIRHHYPAFGDLYDPDTDSFVRPQPFPSWTLVEIPDPSELERADRAPDQKSDPRGTLLGKVSTTRRPNTEEPTPTGRTILIWKAPVERPDETLDENGLAIQHAWDEASLSWLPVDEVVTELTVQHDEQYPAE